MEDIRSKKYFFETGMYRPPSEGGSYSLLIRVTRNCPWNQCAFCRLYKGEKFSRRSVEELKSDIDAIKAIKEDLESGNDAVLKRIRKGVDAEAQVMGGKRQRRRDSSCQSTGYRV